MKQGAQPRRWGDAATNRKRRQALVAPEIIVGVRDEGNSDCDDAHSRCIRSTGKVLKSSSSSQVLRSAGQADGFELTAVWAWGFPPESRDEFTTVELQPQAEIYTLEGPVTVARQYCV